MTRLEYNELAKEIARIQRLVGKVNDRYLTVDCKPACQSLDDIRVEALSQIES